MDDEVIGGFHDDITPFALEQPDQPNVEDIVDADPDTMYAVPGQALIDIADAIRAKRDTVGAISVEDMPLEIGLIAGGGGGTISVHTDTLTSDTEVRPLVYIIPDNIPIDKILFAEAIADRDDIVTAKATSSTGTLLQAVFVNFLPGYTEPTSSGYYGTSIRCAYNNNAFGYGSGGPVAYGSEVKPLERKVEFSGGVYAHRFAKDVPYTISIYYKED